MAKKFYIIRCQGLGFITEVIFEGPPPRRAMEAALRAELSQFGRDPKNGGRPRERWVRAVEIPVVLGGDGPLEMAGAADDAQLRVWAEDAARKKAEDSHGGIPLVTMSGQGAVKNPGE